MAFETLSTLLSQNSYPGRGIVIGTSADGAGAMIAYFIMGRSENSRNRIFEPLSDGMRTRAFEESKLTDPSLIIYHPYRALPHTDLITNGDQTDTIYEFLQAGKTFEEALMTRSFEPDAPNYTPRISGMAQYDRQNRTFSYTLSILKSTDGDPSGCQRFFYRYPSLAGVGHFIHTYQGDGAPLPSFTGEPHTVQLPHTAQELCDLVWSNLNPDNKVSLFVRYVPFKDGEPTQIIRNKNQ